DILGFRKVLGVRRDPALEPVTGAESSEQIITRIATQFGIPRERVLELGAQFRLDKADKAYKWLAIHDRLQRANRAEFKRLDDDKYHGWSSFRKLANKSYPEG